MKNIIGVLVMFFSLFSCSNMIPEMEVVTSEGFVDLNLSIKEITIENDGSFLIEVENIYNNKIVGFKLRVSNNWKKTSIGDTSEFAYWGEGEFINLGDNTKSFLDALAELYEMKKEIVEDKNIQAAIVGLANDPNKLLEQPTKMKFFFNSDSKNLYSEVFINVDSTKKRLEFNEKDNEYRESLIKSLYGLK